MRTRHVCIVTTEFAPYAATGIATHVMQLVAGLLELGNRITVLTYAPGKGELRREGQLAVLVADDPPNGRNLSHFRRFYQVVDHIVALSTSLFEQYGAPELIHCHDWRAFAVARVLAERFRAALVSSVHVLAATSWSWGFSASQHQFDVEAAMSRSPTRVISPSRHIRDILIERMNVPRRRLRVIRNGIERTWFEEPPSAAGQLAMLRRELASDDDQIVLFAGRLSPEKGVVELLHSAREVIEQLPRTVYAIAGELYPSEPYSQYVHSLASNGLLQNRVRLLGRLNRKQLRELYQVCDVAVVPSLWESCPYAVLEAMAAGIPVIATDVGGVPELLRDGDTGLIVRTRVDGRGFRSLDTDELTANQLQLLRSPELRGRLLKTARQFASLELTTDNMVRRIAGVYDEVSA